MARGNLLVRWTDTVCRKLHCTGRLQRRFAPRNDVIIGSLECKMEIVLVDRLNFDAALSVYTVSWRDSHRQVCTSEFLENRDYSGYLRSKLGHLYLISDDAPVGVFCLNGEDFGDLYIRPEKQGRGYGTACVQFAIMQSHCLRLTVLSTNTAAIALYKKNGFRFTGNDILLRDGLWEREMEYTEKQHG